MRHKAIYISSVLLLTFILCSAQSSVKYSSVNPALTLYSPENVYICSPTKYNNGQNIISPNPTLYPWEARLENGMPNVIVAPNGNVSIYISSFIVHSQTPPSKVGAMVYTNNSANITNWYRPQAGLYWYNAAGQTADEKISPTPGSGFLGTNIVAVDVESLGIFDDISTSYKPIKVIYLPQRESGNRIVSAYEMSKTFDSQGILSDWALMKRDRTTKQINFTFDFINADTHMNFLKQNGNYYFVSRLNAKRSYILPGEQVPFSPSDPRKRYRRETITMVGDTLVSKNVELNIALDMSTPEWEPYSMQPFRFPSFENDIWWGLVTMYGTDGVTSVEQRQRTELAISNDGFNWKYLKPGTPFLDNGTSPTADDHGCINIAIPVNKTKFSTDSTDLYYFYAASNLRHVEGRNPGISVATGKYGKIAGLKADNTQLTFYSYRLTSGESKDRIASYSLYNGLFLNSDPYPKILADVTEDPRGKTLTTMSSYAALLIYEYDPSLPNGLGTCLVGSLGSSIEGTQTISNKYESVGFVKNGMNRNTKYGLFELLKKMSAKNPNRIISVKDLDDVPVIVQTILKNSKIYGIEFSLGKNAYGAPLLLTLANSYKPKNLFTVEDMATGTSRTYNFNNTQLSPNEMKPIDRETGTIAIVATPNSSSGKQTLLNIYADSNNNSVSIFYENGQFTYRLTKDGIPFAEMSVAPPTGSSFVGHTVSITLESLHQDKRKYGANIAEQVDIFRVSCPDLSFEQVVPQPIIWNWRHNEPDITASDRANARSFAFLSFTAFCPSMTTMTVGASNSSGQNIFTGLIQKLQISSNLPSGNSDFWN